MTLRSSQFDNVAQHLLAAHPAPDLRGAVVILPNYHVAQPLAQALSRNAGSPALLLPRMVTLNEWAQTIPLTERVIADSQREALLYQQLRKLRWFENADLWSLVHELMELFKQITDSLGELPSDAQSFMDKVETAYAKRNNQSLQLEARLVFELWHVMHNDDELDAARAYQRRLALLAESATHPIYVLRASDWDVLEQNFLDAYATRAAVHVFDLREHSTPVSSTPYFYPASSLEQEARAAVMQIRSWLAEGKREIAVVAQDRVSARRTRALLERTGVLVADETGWTFATLSVSTALDRWLTALQSDFYHHDLLDLLKSPYLFSHIPAEERKATVYRLEHLLRKHNVISHLGAYAALDPHDPSIQRPLSRLQQAAQLLKLDRQHTLADWLSALVNSLDVLGMLASLAEDDAGLQLLQAIEQWQQELSGDTGRYRFSEWRNWLAQKLDSMTYRDSSIESSVRFTHLAATRWRQFDAVVLLGCDANHFPSVGDGGRWFNDAVRASLEIPTRARMAQRQQDDLASLLAMNQTVLITWQQEHNGEPRLLSPWLQLLRDRLEAAHKCSLNEQNLNALLQEEDRRTVTLPATRCPAPRAEPALIPQRISVSAYNALVACPYQFYARQILRLNELDDVQEQIEKRDFGELVHVILQRFHERYARIADLTEEAALIALQQISTEVFSAHVEHNFLARAWQSRWQSLIPSYIAWQRQREASGWTYSTAEHAFEINQPTTTLRGRIDRLDRNGDQISVLDYKTQSTTVLRNKLKSPGEDVQLPSYAAAYGAHEAAFISMDSREVKSVPLEGDIHQLAQLNIDRLESVMQRIFSGSALPANGVDAVCKHCEMRGLCRKGEWQNG